MRCIWSLQACPLFSVLKSARLRRRPLLSAIQILFVDRIQSLSYACCFRSASLETSHCLVCTPKCQIDSPPHSTRCNEPRRVSRHRTPDRSEGVSGSDEGAPSSLGFVAPKAGRTPHEERVGCQLTRRGCRGAEREERGQGESSGRNGSVDADWQVGFGS